jgi:hypothetical protein
MNTKISFLLILILLVVLMLFYYIDLESNIIILLAVTILILLHNIIKKKEHFNINERAAALDSKIEMLLSIAKALQSRTEHGTDDAGTIQGIQFDYSCPFSLSGSSSPNAAAAPDTSLGANQGINLGFNTSLGNITPGNLVNSLDLS